MRLQYHLIASLALAAVFYPYYGIHSLLALSGFFIDVDHYITYVIERKDISLRRAYHFCLGNRYSNVLCVFHSAEFVVGLSAVSLFSPVLFIAVAGVLLHLLMDVLCLYSKGRANETKFFVLTLRLMSIHKDKKKR
ncbi:MAG: hypothetical protein R6U32_02950 [Candidatus Woesearchaeota archaeon]